MKSPSESGLGTSVNWVSGDGSSTSATFSYTFPSDASGDYVITAYTYLSDWSVVQPSYTVTVGSNPTPQTPEPSTPSYHACGSHETWQSGDHSAAGCGTSGHYVCDGSDHSYTYCYVTDSNGNTCTVGSYYVCDYHTHQFPETYTPPPSEPEPEPSATCARAACGETVSDRLAHRIDCGPCNGHYWTCISGAADHHRLKTCRFTECGQTWYACGTRPSCQKPWRQRNGLGCWAQ